MFRTRIPKYLLVLFCFTTLSAQVSFPAQDKNEKLRALVREAGQAEVIMKKPGPAELEILTRNVSIASVSGEEVRIILSPLTVEWFISGNYRYSLPETVPGKGIVSSKSLNQALAWESYPSYSQYDSTMRSFTNTFPGLCRLDTIGSSILGKLVLAVRITSNSFTDQYKPNVFFTSSMHGNETGGFVLMLRLSQYLLQNYGIDPYVTNLVDNLEIWINPLANPDGTYRTGNEIINPVRDNANGYDLNRNFPDPEAPGTIPQKETKDMMRFLSSHRFNLSANFHSGSEVTNYPWDRWARDHADAAWFYQICRRYADTVHVYSPAGYMTDLDNGVTNGYAWYSVYGGRQDYVTWSLNGREITIEIDHNFITPVTALQSLWESNRRSLLGYLENALYGIHGSVVDSDTGGPVSAKITVENHDRDNSEVYSDTATGGFVRLIYPGVWNLDFSADGYRDTVIQNVTVTDRQTTTLDVKLKPFRKSRPDLSHDVVVYPSPASGIIKVIFSDKLKDMDNISIYNISGAKVWTSEIDETAGAPQEIDISRFAAGVYIMVVRNKTTGHSGTIRFTVMGSR